MHEVEIVRGRYTMKFRIVESFDVDSGGNKLTEEQVKYFKNSKIRDNNGRLLVCYRGDSEKRDVFSKGDGGIHYGTYLAAVERQSYKKSDDWYVTPVYLNITKPFVTEIDYEQWDGSSIALVWLFGTSYDGADEFLKGAEPPKAEDTYIPEDFISDYNEIIEIAKMFYTNRSDAYGPGTEQMQKLFSKHGYDGIKYLNAFEGSSDWSYIIFNPNQAKSIYNKYPTRSQNINEEVVNEVYPNKGESKKDFINRFMSVTKDEYPDIKQRYAVALSYWDRRNKK